MARKFVLTGGPKKFFNKKLLPEVSWGKTKNSYVSVSSSWYKNVISEVKTARRKKRLSQESLAKLLGTTQSEVSRFEGGKSNPTVEMLDRIIATLDLEIKILAKKSKK
ncbi:MAG: helix-turn-helix transcriptional regulator [Patescibacteria group bacterium]